MSECPAKRALSKEERMEFREAESRIEAGLASFVETCREFEKIRICGWWEEKHATFEGYILERWGFTSRRHYDRQIAYAGVVNNASASGDPLGLVPQNERQAREIAGLEPAEQRQALTEANADGPPSAARLAEIAARMRSARGVTLEPTRAEIEREEKGIHQRAARDDRAEGLRRIGKLVEKMERIFGVLDSGEQDTLIDALAPFKVALAGLM